MKKKVAVVDGVRTPFVKAMGAFRHHEADDLGAFAVRELLHRVKIDPKDYDEVIVGNVISPPHAYNVGRVIAMKGGFPKEVPAITVSRNCASGMEALVIAVQRILLGDGKIYMAGGSESMTHVPIMFNEKMRDIFMGMSKSKSLGQTLGWASKIRPSGFSPVVPAINDPICGLTMGETAELLARDFHITREDQDAFSALSQQRALEATESGFFDEEIIPVPNYKTGQMQTTDDGIRKGTTAESLAGLKPAFLKGVGTVTAASSSQVTDGSCMLVLMDPDEAAKRGIKPLGYITAYAFSGVDPSRMGIGPAYAIAKVLQRAGLKLSDIDLVEINEAFAAQVLAVRAALNSAEFCKNHLGLDAPVGLIDLDKLNVNGGAIAVGHPLGASGARITLTLLRELKRKGLKRGIASLCVGGGQGEAVIVEVA